MEEARLSRVLGSEGATTSGDERGGSMPPPSRTLGELVSTPASGERLNGLETAFALPWLLPAARNQRLVGGALSRCHRCRLRLATGLSLALFFFFSSDSSYPFPLSCHPHRATFALAACTPSRLRTHSRRAGRTADGSWRRIRRRGGAPQRVAARLHRPPAQGAA